MATLPGPPIIPLAASDGRLVLNGWITLEDTDAERLEREVADAAEPYADMESSGTSSGHGSA
jgi:hypothetical protein